jgi:NhaA family Na+:H+ antiporter
MTKDKKPQSFTFQPYNPMTMFKEFMQLEAAGGLILLLCATVAMIIANSPLSGMYHHILHDTKAVVGIGALVIEKDIIHWINDGLMAIFFFLVGLEIKREVQEGLLSSKDQILLPVIAAIGGMVAPGIVFYLNNMGNGDALAGWAIPTATDIAFAVGVLSLLGKRVPVSLKIFLLALAIIDDLGAILVIAIFYTQDLDLNSLYLGSIFAAGLIALNYFNVSKGSLYILLGCALWVCVLKSGVHATFAGVFTAFCIPLEVPGERRSLLRQLEHDLNTFIAYFVLPLFAFANAGVSLEGITLDIAFEPVTLGVVTGLLVGKQVGIFSTAYICVKTGLVSMPKGATWGRIWGISMFAGIGFTMSLFIATLGYRSEELALYLTEAKLGILGGSFISAIMGLGVMWFFCRGYKEPENES